MLAQLAGFATETSSTPRLSPQISSLPSGEKLGCRSCGYGVCAASSLISHRSFQLVGMFWPVKSQSRSSRGIPSVQSAASSSKTASLSPALVITACAPVPVIADQFQPLYPVSSAWVTPCVYHLASLSENGRPKCETTKVELFTQCGS